MNNDGKLSFIEGLNDAQKEAVIQINGPSLIIAGAGSGKTRVLTNRIANILDQGHSSSSILALTFTNKASKEMKARISSLVGSSFARSLWMGTFHSVFIRFLRIYADRLGFPSSFTIYSATDTKSAIRACVKELQLDADQYKANEVYSRISKAKNNLVTAEAYSRNQNLIMSDAQSKKPMLYEIYALYTKRCKAAGAMDFDDILLYTNILFRDFPETLDEMREQFKYILVDEYQDTNYSQYLIIKKLSSIHRNLCVVGDDAQSIYAFRGARIENILNFKKDYPEAKEFRLEQNYRSTQTIVNAANSVIARNSMQLKKKCFSQAEIGEKVAILKGYTEQEESFLIVSSIANRIYMDKVPYSAFAILYRTNAQSRAIEEALRKRGLPYKIFAGNSFYERAEVKNMLAYLRLIINPKDDEAFKRIINFPTRGIGDTSLGRLYEVAKTADMSLWEAIFSTKLEEFGLKIAAINRLRAFAALITSLNEKAPKVDAYELAQEMAIRSGVLDHLNLDNTIEGQGKLQNVDEFLNSIKEFCESVNSENEKIIESGYDPNTSQLSVEAYLENVSLLSDMDRDGDTEEKNKIVLMTVHASKGLEFPHIYIAGVEDMLFPSVTSTSSEEEVEEERRLFYVALTRAEKSITLSYAETRFKWGSHINCRPSRFIKEIDIKYRDEIADERRDDINGNFRSSESSKNRAFSNSERGGYKANYEKKTISSFQRPIRKVPLKPADPNFIPEAMDKFYVGAEIEHDRFGDGKILTLTGEKPEIKAVVEFVDHGEKTLLLKFAKLRFKK